MKGGGGEGGGGLGGGGLGGGGLGGGGIGGFVGGGGLGGGLRHKGTKVVRMLWFIKLCIRPPKGWLPPWAGMMIQPLVMSIRH